MKLTHFNLPRTLCNKNNKMYTLSTESCKAVIICPSFTLCVSNVLNDRAWLVVFLACHNKYPLSFFLYSFILINVGTFDTLL